MHCFTRGSLLLNFYFDRGQPHGLMVGVEAWGSGGPMFEAPCCQDVFFIFFFITVLSWLIILDRKYKLTSLDYILD